MVKFSVLTYNVWFNESMHIYKRIVAILDIVKTKNPDIILFQEVTQTILSIFKSIDVFNNYH